MLEQAIEAKLIKHMNFNSKLKKDLEKEIKYYYSLLDKLYLDWKQEYLNEIEYVRLKNNFNIKIEDLQRTVNELKIETNVKNLIIKYKHIIDLEYNNQHNIALSFVDSIILHQNGKLTVNWNLANPFLLCVKE